MLILKAPPKKEEPDAEGMEELELGQELGRGREDPWVNIW